MIFLTVGTQFSFDRLLCAVDEAFDRGLVTEEIYAQIGQSSYKPRNFSAVMSIQKTEFEAYLKNASAVIGHAGMGTITMALKHQKPLLVMPRLKEYCEVVNDHQVGIARKFEEAGHILVAYDVAQVPAKINQLKEFKPKPRQDQSQAVADRIRCFLDSLADQGKPASSHK